MKNTIEELETSLKNLPQKMEETIIREGISINEAEKWQKAVISTDKYSTTFKVQINLGSEFVFLRLFVNHLDVYSSTGLVMLKGEVGEEKAEMIHRLFAIIAQSSGEQTRSWVAKDLSQHGGGRYLWRRLPWEGGTWLEKDRIQRQPVMMRAFEFTQALKVISHNLINVEPAEAKI